MEKPKKGATDFLDVQNGKVIWGQHESISIPGRCKPWVSRQSAEVRWNENLWSKPLLKVSHRPWKLGLRRLVTSCLFKRQWFRGCISFSKIFLAGVLLEGRFLEYVWHECWTLCEDSIWIGVDIWQDHNLKLTSQNDHDVCDRKASWRLEDTQRSGLKTFYWISDL